MNINAEIVKNSFYISYSLLLTTGTICFIEAVRTDDAKIRHIMNVEVCISIVASMFYGKFIDMIKDTNINYNKINIVRYNDWFITTPLMLLGLGLVLTYNLGISFKFSSFLIILLLNFGMLISGYLGELNKINKKFALLGGFIFFGLMFYYIYYLYIKDKKVIQNTIIYLLFLFIWSIYGLVYFIDVKIKNIIYNILDTISKCIVGIGFWAYFTKLFK